MTNEDVGSKINIMSEIWHGIILLKHKLLPRWVDRKAGFRKDIIAKCFVSILSEAPLQCSLMYTNLSPLVSPGRCFVLYQCPPYTVGPDNMPILSLVQGYPLSYTKRASFDNVWLLWMRYGGWEGTAGVSPPQITLCSCLPLFTFVCEVFSLQTLSCC